MFGEPWGWSFKTVKCYMGKYIYICSLSTWFLLAPINLFYIHGDSIQVYGKGGPSWSYNINHSNDIPNRAAAVLNWNSAGYVQHTGSQANLAKAQGYVDRQEGIRGKVNQSGTRYIYIYIHIMSSPIFSHEWNRFGILLWKFWMYICHNPRAWWNA